MADSVAEQRNVVRLESLNPIHESHVLSQTLVVGRHPRLCQIVFPDLRISQLHTKLDCTGIGGKNCITVWDLSSNGTFLNGTRIGKGKHRDAVHGDIVSLVITPRLENGQWIPADPNMVQGFVAYKVIFPDHQCVPNLQTTNEATGENVAPPVPTPPTQAELSREPFVNAADAVPKMPLENTTSVEPSAAAEARASAHVDATVHGESSRPPEATDESGVKRANGLRDSHAVDDPLSEWIEKHMTKDRKFEDDYEVGEMIASGGFGEVYRGVHKETGTEVAIKFVNLGALRMKSHNMRPEQYQDEFNIQAQIKHPNIVKLYTMYETRQMLHLILELVKGKELFDVLCCREEGLEEGLCKKLFAPLLDACKYMHSEGVCHRDLKPENILATDPDLEKATLKIADFGLAKIVGTKGAKGVTKIGTPMYMAPEVASVDRTLNQVDKGYGTAADMWGMGVVLFVMLSISLPFDEEDEVIEELLADMVPNRQHNGSVAQVKKKNWFHNKKWNDVSEDAKDLVLWLLTTNQDERPTAEDALQHKWFGGMRSRPEETVGLTGKRKLESGQLGGGQKVRIS